MTELLLPTAWRSGPDPLRVADPVAGPTQTRAAPVQPPESVSAAPTSLHGRFATTALLGVICVAPLPFGSNAPVPIGLLGVALALGLACAPLPRRAMQRRLLMALAILAGIVLGVVALQLAPGIADDPVWSAAARLLDRPVAGSVAVVRGAPIFALGNLALCGASVALGLLIGTERRQARKVVNAAAWSALVYAAIGIVNALVDPEGLLWRDRDAYVGAVLGPFVNRNTAAIYFGCGTVLWAARFGALAARLPLTAPLSAASWRTLAKPGLAAGLCLGAVVASGSRSGTMLSLGGLMAVLLISLRRTLKRLPPRIRSAAFATPAVMAVVTMLSGAVGWRFHSLGFADEGRVAVYRAVLPIVVEHPWLGTGLGTFASIYPSYRSSIPGMRNLWDKAHSTPLELAVETGVPLTILICVAAAAAFALLFRGAFTRRRDADLPLAAAGCFGLAAAHSCLDFSLQIPGLAVVVMGLVGVGLAQAFSSADRKARPRVLADPEV